MSAHAVLLDLDGTLVDSLGIIHAAVVHAISNTEVALPTPEEVASWIGDGSQRLRQRALTRDLDGRAADDHHAAAYAAFQAHYPLVSKSGTVLRDDAAQALQTLRHDGNRLAVITNKNTDQARQTVANLGLDEHLDLVITGQMIGIFKPDPAPLVHAMQLLEVNEAVMVGDSIVDRQAAAAAEIPFVGIRGGYNRGRDIARENPPPEAVIDGLSDLPEAIRELRSRSR